MENTRDDFAKNVSDALAKRAAYVCSCPDCRAVTVAPSANDDAKFIYTGKAAHICAASPGGPRYQADMSRDERKAIQNGIFLCSNCAEMIDKNGGIDFSVEVLREWKHGHEAWVLQNLNKRREEDNGLSFAFNVTSHEQRGGITAGIVQFGRQPRRLGAVLKQKMRESITDKSRTVTVTSTMGDSEAFAFASEIREHLISEGFNVEGVHQALYTKPISGQVFDPTTYTLRVGDGG